ncbi:trypsin-like peptidase domain-containing protein, partial [Roseomonas rosulenta]|uniref:trypsin-like peptidase domain-containing protein n=1 Tax=Roseomonas rosulenta TaxID=2748667 RepID=UPI0018E00428
AALPPGVGASVLRVSVAGPRGGRAIRGTAFIVADSAADPGAPNRVITAAHVVARALEAPDEAAIRLSLPDGTPVGIARVAATARPWNPLAALDPGWSDQAILTLARFDSPAAEAAFRAAPGLAPARRQPKGALLDLRLADGRGIAPGLSGAPVLTAEGRVRGILVQRRIEDWSGSASTEAPLLRRGQTGARLEPAREGWAQPLAAPAILAALGPAGRAVDTLAVPGDADLSVMAPGYLGGRCTVVTASAAYRPAPPGGF